MTERHNREIGRSWAGRRAFVTGATGIVGSWLVRSLLADGAYVVALVRDSDPASELIRGGDIHRVSVVNGAVEDLATLERALLEHEVDTVFHLAAQTTVNAARRSPLITFEANIRGTYNLLEACRRHREGIRSVVVASSDKAYGEQELPYTEERPLVGRHPYDVSKSCADLLAQAYAASYGLPVGIARCGNIYGGGDLNWSRIVPGTVRALLRGERPVIRSDGTFTRDYIYVQDVVDGYRLLAAAVTDQEIRGEAFNFSNECALSVIEIVHVIRRIMGANGIEPLILNEAVGEIRDQYLDASKARTRLGWSPSFSLDEGLAETVAWYRAFLEEHDAG